MKPMGWGGHFYKGPARRRGSTGWLVEASGHHIMSNDGWSMKISTSPSYPWLPLSPDTAALVMDLGSLMSEIDKTYEIIIFKSNFVSYKIHIESTMNDTTDLSSNSRIQSHHFSFLFNIVFYARMKTSKPFLSMCLSSSSSSCLSRLRVKVYH